MDEPRGHYAKRNKLVTEGQILHDSIYMKNRKLSKDFKNRSKDRIMVARDWGGGGQYRELLINVYKISVMK